jgi:thiosulfate/3-mercaptopyruvate sulfurtransferase
MNPLVTIDWLWDRLGHAGTAILDATLPPVGVAPKVDTRARYLEKHIPGAVFFDIEKLSDYSSSLPHMLQSPEEFSRSMAALGVGDAMPIVVYEQEGVFSAPRAWWMLRTFGAREVYLLDGDLGDWVDAGFPVEAGEVRRAPATFHARFDREAVRDFGQIQGLIEESAQILDARSAARFSGAAPEPRAGLRAGHMPGARNVPYTELAESGRLKSAERLREVFAAKGVGLEQPITTTCGSGVTAAVVLLAAEIAGAKQVSLYDGSWAEYGGRTEAVVETGS